MADTPRHGARKARLCGGPADAYLINVENGFTRRGGHVFHLMVGGQAEPFGPWPQAGGGTFVQQLPARRFASARVHGVRAVVLLEPPYPAGGIHGGHMVVLWSEGGHGYLVSLHGERLSRNELVAIALGMARSTRPP